VPGRVGQQVLHDPLHLRRVDLQPQRADLYVHRPALQQLGAEVLDHALDELAEVDALALRGDRRLGQPVQVQQVVEQAVHPARALAEPLQQVGHVVAAELQVTALQGDGDPQHRCQRRAHIPDGGERADTPSGRTCVLLLA
jgi:hypothetical protein